ncbi:hypothetical protein M655_001785 [Brevibacillus sp. NSP2.1]|nr:hypothetical protein M655_001785 [Brevibacillus sp. NSP2.1]
MDSNVSLLLAFGAGLLSFISPCCLPLYPSFLSYITGITAEEVKKGPLVFRESVKIFV